VGWVGFLLLDMLVGRYLGDQVLRSNAGFVPGHPSEAFSAAGLSSFGTDKLPYALPSSSNRIGFTGVEIRHTLPADDGWIQRFDLHLDQVGGGAEGTFIGSLGVDQQDTPLTRLWASASSRE
jgi:hypothetical protein